MQSLSEQEINCSSVSSTQANIVGCMKSAGRASGLYSLSWH